MADARLRQQCIQAARSEGSVTIIDGDANTLSLRWLATGSTHAIRSADVARSAG